MSPSRANPDDEKPPVQQRQEQQLDICKEDIEEFRKYIQNFDKTLGKVNANQFSQLQKKYRFYLAKVERLEEIKNDLQAKYDAIEEYVESSGPVKDQKQSIKFISMISDEATQKLDKLSEKVNSAKEEKKVHLKEIAQLKDQIRKEKDKFFELKRLELKIKNDIDRQVKTNKIENAGSAFQNIVNEKIQRKRQKMQSQISYDSIIRQPEEVKMGYSQPVKPVSSFYATNHKIKTHDNAKTQLVMPFITQSQILKKNITENNLSSLESRQFNATTSSSVKNKSLFNVASTQKLNQLKRSTASNFKRKDYISELNRIERIRQQLGKQNNLQQKISANTITRYNGMANRLKIEKMTSINQYQLRLSSSEQKQGGVTEKLASNKCYKQKATDPNSSPIALKKFELTPETYSAIKVKKGLVRSQKQSDVGTSILEADLPNSKDFESAGKLEFLKLKPEDIMKKILQKGKIAEFLRLVQNQKQAELERCQQSLISN